MIYTAAVLPAVGIVQSVSEVWQGLVFSEYGQTKWLAGTQQCIVGDVE